MALASTCSMLGPHPDARHPFSQVACSVTRVSEGGFPELEQLSCLPPHPRPKPSPEDGTLLPLETDAKFPTRAHAGVEIRGQGPAPDKQPLPTEYQRGAEAGPEPIFSPACQGVCVSCEPTKESVGGHLTTV